MMNKIPHVHAAIIAAWSQDIKRRVICRDPAIDGPWRLVVGAPTWPEKLEFAFADSIQDTKVVSSLSSEEIRIASFSIGVSTHTLASIQRSIANAGAQRAYEDLKIPSEEWFKKVTNDGNIEVYRAAISKYINDVRKGSF